MLFLKLRTKKTCSTSFLYFSSNSHIVQEFIIKWSAICVFPVLPLSKFWRVLCNDPCYILTVDSDQESRGSWSKTPGFGFFLQNAQKSQMLLLAIRKNNTCAVIIETRKCLKKCLSDTLYHYIDEQIALQCQKYLTNFEWWGEQKWANLGNALLSWRYFFFMKVLENY